MSPEQAVAALGEAFASKRPPQREGRIAGVFGNGLPTALISAMGFAKVDVEMAPEAELSARAPEIEPYIEPFVDDYTRVFLHRLLSGKLDDLDAIVFCRDDAAALVAYQYALEFQRQAIGRPTATRLVLWNLVHRRSDPAVEFNARQVGKLRADLGVETSSAAYDRDLAAKAAIEDERREALSKLDALRKADGSTITATEAFVWRNAGRYLAASDHARLLALACDDAVTRPAKQSGRRIALIGSRTDSLALFDMIEQHGRLVTDLQPFGEVWPGPQDGQTLAGILEAEASDPFCPRAEPAALHRDAIVARCVADRCDVVVSQIDQNDDSVGWDLPSLAAALRGEGITFIDLGFRDHRPDAHWLEQASAKIRSEAGGPA